MKLLVLLPCLSFAYVPAASSVWTSAKHRGVAVRHYHSSRLMAVADPSGSNEEEAEEPSNSPYGSDLKALLPTPKKRTLKLDKLGRRIHDLTDDGTAKYLSKDGNGSHRPVTADSNVESAALVKSEKELAADASSAEFVVGLLSNIDEESTAPVKSEKELAADASSAEFVVGPPPLQSKENFQALLPKQKMSFMKLDKFGRRIQRMEDDGTVNMKKEPTMQHVSSQQQPNQQADKDADATTSVSKKIDEEPLIVKGSPSLAKLLGGMDKKQGSNRHSTNDAMMILGEGGSSRKSADLKELLPKQKMRFMKLDKLGRRVQRMEDDGTVNMKKEPSATNEDAAVVDLDSGTSGSEQKKSYGSLKDLMPTKRAVWTKLDFKGGSVEDERRTKSKVGGAGGIIDDSNIIRSGQGLKDLLPERATWTKLDFKGASVVDERRKKSSDAISNSGGSSFNEGRYSNLKTLLPARTITWKKDQVLSSGSAAATSISESERVRGLREERQEALRDEVIASSASNYADENDNDVEEEEEEDSMVDASSISSSDDEDEEEVKAYTNLKDLLPERKFLWRGR